ncbi:MULTISPECIES: hypothetical protein [Natronococcus]|uniref:Uncharacterized protein n=1 Tax=Natronococcus jeotgali DSM 18795 TaxID=1227498 RepID=L9XXZ4_9EURY|nr:MULTISPECIES: hypothetical protein [Natronococcus]ELY66367.1 hypothetical protein C492_00544 [Natronococcus jeotgali DSM 18795]NKE37772.1 hypothetical protein [Natronococcus sp. JC468]
MTSVADNRARGLDVEDESCRQWPLKPIVDDCGRRDDWYDLVATEPFSVAARSVDAGDPIECKSCWVRYESRQRRGQWWISRANHERLVNASGWYILSVVAPDTEYIVRMSLVAASVVDGLIDGTWWNCGRGGQTVEQYKQLPWSTVFDPAEVPGGERA